METRSAFQPSSYQQDIFDFLATETGHLQIAAVAGSGKTTTLIEALKRLPINEREGTLMCAFNKEIAGALSKRVPEGVTVKTNHAIGFGALAYHFGGGGSARWNPQVTEGKYRKLIEIYWTRHIRRACDPELESEGIAFQLLHFARVTLSEASPSELIGLAARHEVDLPEDAAECLALLAAIPVLLKWGAEGIEYSEEEAERKPPTYGPDQVIDFDDMIWLPWRLGVKPRRFKVVMVDEAQDLNAAQLSLVLKSLAPNGRLVAVGDPHQAIYGFTGADAEVFDRIRAMTEATLLPLSVCYRCPVSVINRARLIVPEIEASDDAPIGSVREISEDTFACTVTNRDMVLCRVNAPLISTAFRLIADGKAARVRGRDIGVLLIKTIQQIARMIDWNLNRFEEGVARWEEQQVRDARVKGSESLEQSVRDRADCVRSVHEGAVCEEAKEVNELINWVKRIFADDGAGCIVLSSIHKAKGLEAKRVFILRHDLLPHPAAKSASARQQELNLQYVAYTRAMEELYIVRSQEGG